MGKLPGWLWGLVALGILGAAAGGIRWAGERSARAREARMRIRVCNSSGAALSSVAVNVSTTWGGPPVLTLSRPALAAGESFEFHPGANHLYVSVSFGGRTPPAVSVDLWTGERYLIQIRPDGSLDGNYDAPPRAP